MTVSPPNCNVAINGDGTLTYSTPDWQLHITPLPAIGNLEALACVVSGMMREQQPSTPAPEPELPLFNEYAHCAKCLAEHLMIRVKYEPAKRMHTLSGLKTTGEHFQRECVRCGYSWKESIQSIPRVATMVSK